MGDREPFGLFTCGGLLFWRVWKPVLELLLLDALGELRFDGDLLAACWRDEAFLVAGLMGGLLALFISTLM